VPPFGKVVALAPNRLAAFQAQRLDRIVSWVEQAGDLAVLDVTSGQLPAAAARKP
jgi:hypothetical protein